MKELLQTQNLAAGYGHHVVADDINITIYPGTVTTLIGPNGAGKSTILKTITKQLKSLRGDICIGGDSIKELSEKDISRKMSMVMTEPIRAELMTCREVVATGRYPYTGRLGILSEHDWKEVDDAICKVHAREVADMLFQEVSDGQKQRIMLARAICQNTDILILDEPTSYLDMRYKIDILGSIRKMAVENKKAILASLHEVELAYKISDQIICVENGKIGRIGTPEEIFCDNYIQKIYGISENIFDSKTGMLHFPANKEKPRVFVIAGGGSGSSLFYTLQRKNIPFAAGILPENDMDYAVAKAVASKVISSKAFCPIPKEQTECAKSYIDSCEMCICTLEENDFGMYYQEGKELLRYAEKKGKLADMQDIKIIDFTVHNN